MARAAVLLALAVSVGVVIASDGYGSGSSSGSGGHGGYTGGSGTFKRTGQYYQGSGSEYYPGSGNVVGVGHTYGSWSYWSVCSKHCGGGYRTRTRTCERPKYLLYGSYDCTSSDLTESEPCNTHYCVVHGGWSSWGTYDSCSADCGHGYQTRHRTCTNPAPSHGGEDCHGSSTDSIPCTGTGYHCQVDGVWSAWGTYDACSSDCGHGTQTRYRYCNNPAPSHGGADCAGYSSSQINCVGNGPYCPVNGAWSSWGTYSPCTSSCGEGTKTRHRYCNNPSPKNGGLNCAGDDSQYMTCYGDSHYCPVDGVWGAWTYWTPCSVTCGKGHRTRERYCDSPAPSHDGLYCVGSGNESETCHNSNSCHGYGHGIY